MAVSEESAEESAKLEAETGFGTGLRGKLKKRQEVSAEAPAPPSSNGAPPQHEARPGEPEAALEPPPALSIPDTAELDALRAELAASLDRERDLRVELAAVVRRT